MDVHVATLNPGHILRLSQWLYDQFSPLCCIRRSKQVKFSAMQFFPDQAPAACAVSNAAK
eukprot:894074-Pelagomonas_calceolata.AAC.3